MGRYKLISLVQMNNILTVDTLAHNHAIFNTIIKLSLVFDPSLRAGGRAGVGGVGGGA